MASTESGLYEALENALTSYKEPVTCVELYEVPVVRRLAESSNRVSDYLGNMWRRGDLLRYPAPHTNGSMARWAYALKPKTKKRKSFSQPVPAPIRNVGEDIILMDLPNGQIIFRAKHERTRDH